MNLDQQALHSRSTAWQGRGRFGGTQYLHDPDLDGRVAQGEVEVGAETGTIVEMIPASILTDPELVEDICEHVKWKWCALYSVAPRTAARRAFAPTVTDRCLSGRSHLSFCDFAIVQSSPEAPLGAGSVRA